MKSKDITKEIEEKIVNMYKNGKSYEAIKKEFDINTSIIKKILKKNNVEIRTNGGKLKSQLPIDEIIDKYVNKYISSTKLAEEYNVTWTTILNILRKNNIEIRSCKDKYKNLSLLDDYFDNIDSPDKAYFLGFLITDGNIYKNRHAIALELAVKDEYLVKLFSDTVKNTTKLYYRKSKQTVRVAFVSKRMKESLSKFGVIPNKTGKEYLPILDDEKLMSHLIRGIFDGDGWITFSQSKNVENVIYKQIGLCGNETFVTQVRDFLVSKLSVKKVKVIQTERSLWQVSWASMKDIDTICNYIYKDKDKFFLPRKYKKFMEIPR